MAEAASLPTIEEEEIGEDFYDQIQAPKFVDFTAPEIRPSHEDRYWFCFRVGCDQNHGEELDSEAIYKNFVLRVMAARSPNVRLRKALNKREASANLKCPLTAPAKSSKSRVPRLALISSMSENMVDNKPLSKVSATPSAKLKQSSAKAKALTTPSRNQKKSSNLEQFRTVQSKKAMNLDVPKNRVIAKTLVFHSPKKAVKIKSSIELKKTPMKSLCSAMKKLELDSVKKKNEEASRKKFRGREVKSRVFDSLYSNRRLNEEKQNKKKGASKIHEGGHDSDSSDMEIDEKSRGGSLERCTESSSSEKKHSREEDEETRRIPEGVNRNDNDDNKENEGEFTENDEKENASVPDENRVLVNNHDNLKHENTMKTHKKPTSNATGSQVVKYRKLKPTNPKPFKLRTDERGILKEANLEKKPLSPLKETTAKGGKALRKHHQKNDQDTENNSCKNRLGHATQEDQSRSVRCPVLDKSNVKVKNKLCAAPKLQKHIDLAERLKQRDKAAQNLDDKFKRKSQMMQPKLVRPKGALSRKKENGVLATPGKQQLSVIDEKSSNISQHKEEEAAKAYNNGASPTTKAISQPREEAAAKAYNSGASPTTKACGASSCSSSRAKKATTVPKEPNFHSLHVPKSCIKKIT